MKRVLLLLALVGLWPFAVASAADGAASTVGADVLLARVDEALNRYQTMQLRYRVNDLGPRGTHASVRRIEVSVSLSAGRRLLELLSPADTRGTKVLLEPDMRMYVYLPQLRKIRRVVSNLPNRSVLGTAVRHADILLQRYQPRYRARLVGQTPDALDLHLEAREGQGAPYPAIGMRIDPQLMVPRELRYFNERGMLLRSEVRDGYVCDHGMCLPRRMQVVDHTGDEHTTVLELLGYQVNQPFRQGLLSKRGLLR